MFQEFMDLLLNIEVKDIIDIFIVGIVFYKLHSLIKETRAKQLIKGIIFLLIITQLSDWFNLYVINWILRNTMTVGFIALIIVFQPELRRALEYIGRTKLLTKSLSDMEDERLKRIYKEISEAVSYMSREKIGALIVLEKDIGLGEITATGTKVDSVISTQIIVNIFMANTPLHDGAVIIKKERLLAAGCFLPLTDNTSLSKDLGTRHRAGIGMSEKSDALIIMVSEETGAISIAQNGKLSRFLDSKTLEVKMMNTFLKEKKEKKFKFKRSNKK